MIWRSVLGIVLVASSFVTVRADPPQLQIGRAAPAVFTDGRVLVIGGDSIEGALRSVESWDTAGGGRPSFRYAGKLASARAGHTATVLPDGGVLVVGGGRTRVTELRKPEGAWDARDMDTQGWSAAGSLADNRWFHTASLLPDGRVLVVGGMGDGNRGLASAEIWTPSTRAWRNAGRLREARWNHAAVVLGDGRVLIAGGWRSSNPQGAEALDSAEVWDPKTERWSPTGALPAPAAQLTASLLPDGRVLAAGGKGDAGNPASGNPIWNPKDGQWSKTGSSLWRYDHTASVLADGRIVAIGGVAATCGARGCSWDPTSAVQIWTPGQHAWTLARALRVPRTLHSVVALPDGRLVIIGGSSWRHNEEYTAHVEVMLPP